MDGVTWLMIGELGPLMLVCLSPDLIRSIGGKDTPGMMLSVWSAIFAGMIALGWVGFLFCAFVCMVDCFSGGPNGTKR